NVLCLFCYHLVTLTHKHVKYGLSTNDLRRWCNQRRLSQILTNSRNFFQNIVIFIFCMLVFQLRSQVGKHTAWHLIQKGLDIYSQVLRIQKAGIQSLITNRTEIIGNLCQQVLIKSRIIGSSFKGLYHNLCSWLGSSQSKG